MSMNKDSRNVNNTPNNGNNNSFFSNFPPFLGTNNQNNYSLPEPIDMNNPGIFLNNAQNFNHLYNQMPFCNPYIPYNNNFQCLKCIELQNEIAKMKSIQQNSDMQIMLTNKNIELVNEQIKLLDMKISASIQTNKNNSIDNNKNNSYKYNNRSNYKQFNNQNYNKKDNHVNRNFNNYNNKNVRNKYTNFNNNYRNNNKNRNLTDQYLYPFSTPPFLPINKNRNTNTNNTNGTIPDVIIQIDDVKPFSNNSCGSMGNRRMDPFNFLGPILSIIEGLEKKKKTTEDDNETEEYDDEISEYDSDEEFEELDIEIKTIDDLINLGKEYDKIKMDDTNTTASEDNSSDSNIDNNNNNNGEDDNENEDCDNIDEHIIIQYEKGKNDEKNKIKNSNQNKNKEKEKEKEKNKNNNKNMNKIKTKTKETDINPWMKTSIKSEDDCEHEIPTFNKLNIIQGIMTKDGKIKFLKNEDNKKKSPLPKKNYENNEDVEDRIENKENKEDKEIKHKKIYDINGKKYSINLEILNRLVKPLTKLQSMIGLDNVKNAIVDMIMYYLQSFEKKNNNMLHTVIEGPPGVGKTELGKILAEIYAGLGIIKSNKFKLVKRSDLVGEYLGHTAPKTQRVIDEAEGGVLFIDEAYALGNEEKRDSFSKECIDVINQNLSENKKKFICIIAGYPDELDKCFFAYNEGLKRRFPFRFKIDGYKPEELRDIFIKKVNDIKWKLNDNDLNKKLLTEFFTKNKEEFKYYGGDIDTLLLNCKFAHSRRIFGKHPKNRRNFNKKDVEIGFDRFIKYKKKNDVSESIGSMYL